MLFGKRTCLQGLVHLGFSFPLLHRELAKGEMNQAEAISYLQLDF